MVYISLYCYNEENKKVKALLLKLPILPRLLIINDRHRVSQQHVEISAGAYWIPLPDAILEIDGNEDILNLTRNTQLECSLRELSQNSV